MIARKEHLDTLDGLTCHYLTPKMADLLIAFCCWCTGELSKIMPKKVLIAVDKMFFMSAEYSADFDSFAQTKEPKGRQWEHLTMEEQAEICQQYYKENNRKPFYLMFEKRISHEKLEQYQALRWIRSLSKMNSPIAII